MSAAHENAFRWALAVARGGIYSAELPGGDSIVGELNQVVDFLHDHLRDGWGDEHTTVVMKGVGRRWEVALIDLETNEDIHRVRVLPVVDASVRESAEQEKA